MPFAVPRMDPLQSRAWLALVASTQLLPAALDQHLLAEARLTHFEYMVLGILHAAEGRRLRLTRLASATNATLPRLSKVATRLEARGLVERRPCPGDGRAINLHLSRAGRRLWVQVTPAHLAMARDQVLGGLSPAQLEALAEALEVVVRGLDPEASFGVQPAP